MSCWRSFLGLVTPVDLLWSRRKRMPAHHSPAECWAVAWGARVGNFSGALGFIFCGVKHLCLAGGVSPRAWSRRPSACVWRSGYWFTTWRERSDWTRTSEAKIFRAREEPKIFASAYRSLLLWTRHSGVTVFPSARGSKNRYPAEGVSPRAWSRRPSACVWRSGYWFESEEQIKQEPPRRSLEGSCFMRSPDWTRTSNPSINSRMLCQLSYGGLFCFRCWFPLQRIITIPGLFGLRNLKCREVHHSLGCAVGLRG